MTVLGLALIIWGAGFQRWLGLALVVWAGGPSIWGRPHDDLLAWWCVRDGLWVLDEPVTGGQPSCYAADHDKPPIPDPGPWHRLGRRLVRQASPDRATAQPGLGNRPASGREAD